jgi:hypothetical protein
MKKIIYGSTSPETAVVVNNYPWGFKLKTSQRYWIETTKHGDRFVTQTLNPKTNAWCNPKKSTYSAVLVMTTENKDDKTFVHHIGLSLGYSNAEQVATFETQIDKSKLNESQLKMICKCKAINKTNELVKVEIVESTCWTTEQRLEHDKKQEEIKSKLAGYANKVYNNLVKQEVA